MNKRAMIVIFSVVIIVLLITLIWGISVRDGWNGWERSMPDSSAGLSTGTVFEFDPSEVQELDVDLLSEKLEIVPAEDGVLRVEQSSAQELSDANRIRCGLRDGRLIVQANYRRVVSCGWNDQSWGSLVRVSVPKTAVLQLNAQAMSGLVNVRDLGFRDVRVETASGTITLENIRADELTTESASGSVDITGSRFDAVRCETASGDIAVSAETRGDVALSSLSGRQRFAGSCRDFRADAASGDVDAEIRGAGTIQAEAMSGSLSLVCPDASSLSRIDAETASGTVNLTVPAGTALAIDFDSMSGNLNLADGSGILTGGGIEVEVETASGDFNLRTLPV